METVLAIEPQCKECKNERVTSARAATWLAMEPGDDGVEWFLCARCWYDGMHPNSGQTLDRAVAILEPAPRHSGIGTPSPS